MHIVLVVYVKQNSTDGESMQSLVLILVLGDMLRPNRLFTILRSLLAERPSIENCTNSLTQHKQLWIYRKFISDCML